MHADSFRFLHAADLHLELPLQGLDETPEHLESLMIDAPLSAARRIFESAVLEQVDFVILAGDVLNSLKAGPFAIAFLLEQFRTLDEHQISVYWAGGREDPPEQWPDGIELPERVYRFPTGRVETFTHTRGDIELAAVSGQSWSKSGKLKKSEFSSGDGELFQIGVAHGMHEGEKLTQSQVNYWALGGPHQRATWGNSPHIAHCPGGSQGRSPDEIGTHGCTLVHVDKEGGIRLQTISTQQAHWRHEKVKLPREATREDLELALAERVEQMAANGTVGAELVSWTVHGGSPKLASELLHHHRAEDVLRSLRQEFGHRDSVIWSVDLQYEPSAEWLSPFCDEDTILGDFLRAAHARQTSDEPLDLKNCLPEFWRDSLLASAANIRDSETRTRILRKAALLGLELLRGEDAA